MATKIWQVRKIRYCEHAGCEVALEVEAIYPEEFMPEQPARHAGERCSQGLTQCNSTDKPACVWSGTNPNYDPYK